MENLVQEEDKNIQIFTDPDNNPHKKVSNNNFNPSPEENGDEFNQNSNNDELQKLKTPFTIDILKIAAESFDTYMIEVKGKKKKKIDMFEVQNLLDVLGIKKNEYEIGNKISELKSENPKKFPYENKYTRDNFVDIVDAFRNYRIDEKLLVACFRKIDKEEDGTIGLFDLRRINMERNLKMSEEEIFEILEFFEMDEKMKHRVTLAEKVTEEQAPYLTFEKFCKLYYQG